MSAPVVVVAAMLTFLGGFIVGAKMMLTSNREDVQEQIAAGYMVVGVKAYRITAVDSGPK